MMKVRRPSSVVESFLVKHGCAVDARGATGVKDGCVAGGRRVKRSPLECTWWQKTSRGPLGGQRQEGQNFTLCREWGRSVWASLRSCRFIRILSCIMEKPGGLGTSDWSAIPNTNSAWVMFTSLGSAGVRVDTNLVKGINTVRVGVPGDLVQTLFFHGNPILTARLLFHIFICCFGGIYASIA